MHAIHQHRARRAVLVAAAVAVVPAAWPSGASAHHQCVDSETYVNVQPGNASQPVESGHRLPLFYACGPHRVWVGYTDGSGATDEFAVQQGELSYTHREAERQPAQTSRPSSTPQEQSRPARRAKRSCRASRRAKTRAQRRAQRRAVRRCRAQNRG